MSNQKAIPSAINQVDLSGIDSKHVKEKLQRVALAAIELVNPKTIISTIEAMQTDLATLRENSDFPNGSDVKRTFRIWNSRQAVGTMLAVFAHFGLSGQLRKRVFHYASVCGAQRSGKPYLAMKAMQKLWATCAWLVSGDMLCWKNVNKYLAAQIITAEVLDVDMVKNQDIYNVYMGHSQAIADLTSECDVELRTLLNSHALYKAASTSSTQRTTSANILQILDAGVNAGNERVIYFDRDSAVYKALRATLFNTGDAAITIE